MAATITAAVPPPANAGILVSVGIFGEHLKISVDATVAYMLFYAPFNSARGSCSLLLFFLENVLYGY